MAADDNQAKSAIMRESFGYLSMYFTCVFTHMASWYTLNSVVSHLCGDQSARDITEFCSV